MIKSGNDEFNIGVAKSFEKIIVSAIEPFTEEMATRLMNRLLGFDVSETSIVGETHERYVLGQIVKGTSEIQSAYENLLDVEIYIRRFPYKDTRISKSRHLRNTIENYLNQVYVLKQRLKKFLQNVETLYAKGEHRKEVKKITQPLFTYLKNSFDNVVAIRGSSVHRESFDNKDLSQLDGLDFAVRSLSDSSAQNIFADFFDSRYVKIRQEWYRDIKALNKTLKDVLDEYYSRLYQVVFDEKGEMIIPDQE
jgi:hypothetical protein